MIIDGKKVASDIKARVRDEIVASGLGAASAINVGLAVIIAGDNSASRVYVRNKQKACEECGIKSYMYELPADVSERELLDLIATLNADKNVHGILVQQPTPPQIDDGKVVEAISSYKDVDAFRADSAGRIMQNRADFLPCTPAGIMELLREADVTVAGAECVVVGRSDIVGKPMAMLLLHANGTVTVCHSRTKDLAAVTRRADILVAAVGKAKFITADMVKPGATVIDVGMNRDGDGKLCGDVDYDRVREVAGNITPVPGGVGPTTVAVLMQNTLQAAKMASEIQA